MRILHFFKTAVPDTMGGVEQVVHQIAKGAQSHGIATDVLALSARPAPPSVDYDGYRLHRVRQNFQLASTGFSLAAFRRFAELAEQADVVHYHFPWPFMDLVHFASKLRKPSLVTYHSDIIRQKHLLALYRPLKHRFLGSVDRIVATSPNYLASSEVLQQYADKVSVIPIGLDKGNYPEPSSELLEYWRQRVGARFFLFVGVLRYYKGLHILIEAARDTDFPIVIVGAGPIEQALKEQAGRLGLRNIIFLGPLPEADKVALLTLSYGVVFPSHLRSEAFGVSLLEGAMYGKPMISSEIGTGTTFVNIANETGLVVAPSNPDDLRQAMRFLWEHPDIAGSMGRRAEQRYLQKFTGQKMVDAYVSLYEQLAGR